MTTTTAPHTTALTTELRYLAFSSQHTPEICDYPDSGKTDADTLSALEAAFGHQDFGVYATVIAGGMVATGDEWSLT